VDAMDATFVQNSSPYTSPPAQGNPWASCVFSPVCKKGKECCNLYIQQWFGANHCSCLELMWCCYDIPRM